jgi:osmotically-inducible protein OsmY
VKALLPLLLAAALFGCRTNQSPEGQVHDMEIAASVKSKMISDVGLSTIPNVAINSTNGVVTLAGQVDSDATRSKIEAIARGTPHVVRVIDNLQVAATQ